MRFPRKTPSASAPRHFCVLRFGGPRRDDASDTCGACNVLNQTRGQTSQSVVCVSQRREERVRETVGTPFPGRERENAFGRVLFCIEALPKTRFQTKDSCERRKNDDERVTCSRNSRGSDGGRRCSCPGETWKRWRNITKASRAR